MSNYEGGRGRRVKVSDSSEPVFVATEKNLASEVRFSFNDYCIITELINFVCEQYQEEEKIQFLTRDLSSLYIAARISCKRHKFSMYGAKFTIFMSHY